MHSEKTDVPEQPIDLQCRGGTTYVIDEVSLHYQSPYLFISYTEPIVQNRTRQPDLHPGRTSRHQPKQAAVPVRILLLSLH